MYKANQILNSNAYSQITCAKLSALKMLALTSHTKMPTDILHELAHGPCALLVVTLGLRQVPPARLQIRLTAPVEVVGKI
jgi:hypothetical protein